MNSSNEETASLSLFKYTSSDLNSQLLIETNESQVQVDHILDGFENGTVTWNNGEQQQPLLINTKSDGVVDGEESIVTEQQQLLQDLLNEENVQLSSSKTDENIHCSLEIADKEFLANNGLFIRNEPPVISHSLPPTKRKLSENDEHRFIDINGLLINPNTILSVQQDEHLLVDNNSSDTATTTTTTLYHHLNNNIHNKSKKENNNEMPDSTVEESFNINDIATVLTLYQCKKCDFHSNDQSRFLEHFQNLHLNSVPEIFTNQNNNNSSADFIDRRKKYLNNSNTGQTILNNSNNIFCINTGLSPVTEQQPNRIVEGINKNIMMNESERKMIQSDEFDKRIMRVKRKKRKTKNATVLTFIPQLVGTTEQNNMSFLIMNEQNNSIERSNNQLVVIQDEQSIYCCNMCNQQFLTIDDCRTHMIQDHEFVEKTIIECATDDDPLNIIETDRDREIETQNEKNKKIIDMYLADEDSEKTRNKMFKCPKRGCKFGFVKEELLVKHLSCHFDEAGIRVFKCSECSSVYHSWRKCSLHLWKCHQLDLDLFSCPLCTYKSSTFMHLKYHVKIHSSEREYVCPECGRAFKQVSQLRNHRVIHIEDRNQLPHWYIQKYCDKCGKVFADSKCLKKHVQAVHSKLKPFICNVCGHCCARKAMLQMHLRQHTGEKPYACQICFYRTGDHNSLRRHMMRHSGNRPYKCPHCNYTAIQSNSYKNHLASKHPGMSGSFSCNDCSFNTVSQDFYENHMQDHRLGHIIIKDKGRLCKLNDQQHQSNIQIQDDDDKSSLDENEDDETHNCFLSLQQLNEEQTVDTGGITIPADPDHHVS